MNKIFEFKEDWLQNSNRVETFINDFLIPPNNRKAVIGLNSEYGTGKSIFIELCEKEISLKYQKEIQSISINLSENEFDDNPLFTILNAIINKTIIDKNNQRLSTDELDQISRLGKLALKMTSSINTDFLNKDCDDAEKKLQEVLTIDKLKVKNKFKKYLERVIGEHKLVIFLDDLDRCSPFFAIKILEELKFYFKFIDNLIFVIAYDREQLESFIRSRFGKEIDCNGYLIKFFDTNYLFSNIDKTEFLNNTAYNCLEYLYNNLDNEYSDEYILIQYTLKPFIKRITKLEDLLKYHTLRSMQQSIYRLLFGLKRALSNDIELSSELEDTLVLLMFIRTTNWKLYTDLYKGKINGVEFCNELWKDNKQRLVFNRRKFIYLLTYNQNSKEDNFSKIKSEVEESISNCNERIYELKQDRPNQLFINELTKFLEKNTDNDFIIPYIIVKSCFDILEYD